MDATKPLIEQRLAALEDELAIYRIIASYGPMVDSGLTDLAPDLIIDDGVYDVDTGRISNHKISRRYWAERCIRASLPAALPMSWVDGDRAVAINPTKLYRRIDGGYQLLRVAQNVWNFERTAVGWKVKHRINRVINDDDAARAIVEAALRNDDGLAPS